MAADAISVLDNLIREELPYTIHESLPAIAPVYKHISNTSFNVMRDKGIGRQWKVLHLFNVGVAGLMQSANPVGPATETGTYYPQAKILDDDGSDLAPFPTAVQAPHTHSLKRELVLQMATGNFSMPITWLQGDTLTASQIAQVARDIKAVGQLRAITEAQSFFMSSQNTLARIDNYDSTGEASGYVDFTVASGSGRTQFFRIGMMVDVLDNTDAGAGTSPRYSPNFGTAVNGTDVKNYVVGGAGYLPLVVANVNYLTGTIRLASSNGLHLEAADLMGDAIADNDFVVLRACGTVSGREMRTWGVEDWIKDAVADNGYIMSATSGTVALDVNTYSQFASKIRTVNGPLTDDVMNGNVGGFLDSYPGATVDTIITTMGVTLKYLQQPNLYNNRMTYERQGKALDLAGGWQEVTYSFNGKSMRWIVAPMCLGGTLYAIKMNNGNIKRYVPPRIGGTDSRVGGDIEFLAPLAGHSNIFKVAHNSSGASQAVLEAPFWQYGLLCPVDVRSVKLNGLTEATGVTE